MSCGCRTGRKGEPQTPLQEQTRKPGTVVSSQIQTARKISARSERNMVENNEFQNRSSVMFFEGMLGR